MKRFIAVAAVLLFAAPLFAETERVLVPIFTPPLFGAHGSFFVTELFIGNAGSTPVTIRDLHESCDNCSVIEKNYQLGPGKQLASGDISPTGKPGRFLILDGEEVDAVSMNLRVRTLSPDVAADYGVEIPVIRERNFRINEITFFGVPIDHRFRNMLRIYSNAPVDVLVYVESELVGDPLPVRVRLTGGTDLLDPAYGVFTAFPEDTRGPLKVRIVADPDFISLLPIEIPLWAFISMTNNTTNSILTITPQP